MNNTFGLYMRGINISWPIFSAIWDRSNHWYGILQKTRTGKFYVASLGNPLTLTRRFPTKISTSLCGTKHSVLLMTRATRLYSHAQMMAMLDELKNDPDLELMRLEKAKRKHDGLQDGV